MEWPDLGPPGSPPAGSSCSDCRSPQISAFARRREKGGRSGVEGGSPRLGELGEAVSNGLETFFLGPGVWPRRCSRSEWQPQLPSPGWSSEPSSLGGWWRRVCLVCVRDARTEAYAGGGRCTLATNSILHSQNP